MKRNIHISFTLISCLLTRFHVALSSFPQVDYDLMGKVGVFGAFAGLDLANSSSTFTLDPSTSTLLSRSSNGSLSRIGSTNSGGSVSAGCPNGDIFYIAGNFSSFSSVGAQNIVAYHTLSNTMTPLGSGGPNGVIHAIYCDSKNGKVWVGGAFTSPGSLVAVWNVGSSSWSAPPFGGLSGAAAEVLSISANSSQSSLLFTGSFLTSFQGNQSLNGTNNPNVPFSSGATPYSSSLVPIPLQNAQINASPSSSDPQFNNIQNILCPTAADGAGQTWLAADGITAVITVRTFASLSAAGVRLGNTFLNGHATTTFTLTSIPDNNVQTLTYVNPSTGQNQTCSQNCPLSTDPTVLYQDFLFTNVLYITGFQLTLTGWNGSGAGLHILQLLSSGAFASAVGSNNVRSCYAPSVSNTTSTAVWTQEQANTNIAGTVQTILAATVPVGTPSSQSPSFTWEPYVSASGQYDIRLLVPGCLNFQDCALRTSVTVTVFPGGNQQPWVSTVLQTNEQDASALIYQGAIVPSSPNFVTTITMTLADNPTGSGQGGQYKIIADRVQLILTQANVNNSLSSNSSTYGVGQTGFGFFEWPLTSSVNNVNSSNVLPNSTITYFDIAAFDLYNALGSSGLSASSGSSVAAVSQYSSAIIYLGGVFSLSTGPASGAQNVVAFMNGVLVKLPNDGLNGAVSSLLLVGQQLYVGGSFSGTVSGPNDGSMTGVAVYDLQQNQWSSLGGGVRGVVTSLGYFGGQIQVAGNFTEVFQTKGSKDGSFVGGFAVWNINQNVWVNSGGFSVGSVSVVMNGTGTNDEAQFIAGNLLASLRYGASGFATLATGNGLPSITPLGTSLSPIDTQTSLQKRESEFVTHMINFSRLFKRQSTPLASLPPSPVADSPAVLAGAFWTNTSSSHQVVILGGNFTFSTSEGLAVYDMVSGSTSPLPGASVNGTIHALLLYGSDLYVGGEFTVVGSNVNGMAIYNLALGQWDTTTLQPLISSSGPVVVRSLTTSSSKTGAVFVAGSFDNAGSLSCRAICSLDTVSKQWNTLGGGISGNVSDVVYAGTNQDVLIASGSLALADSSPASVVSFSFSNNTWGSLGNQGDLAGPATAVEVNNGNLSSIFVAGRSNDGSSSFLSFWNGNSWTSLNSTFGSESNITQLTMVPVVNYHNSNGIIEADRMLLVSGTLYDSSFGNASSVLFDGQTFLPYLVSLSATGSSGSIAGLVHSFSSFSFSRRHFLAVGIVILISIAIAAGVVFLLALFGILWTLFSRKDDGLNKLDPNDEEDDESVHQRPSSLLAHVNAATRTTILGPAGSSSYIGEKEEAAGEKPNGFETHDPFGPDASNYLRAETPSDAIIGAAGETRRPGHARYSFDGAGEGELSITAGMELEILDDHDQAWWLVRDPRTGHEGVIPAAYLY